MRCLLYSRGTHTVEGLHHLTAPEDYSLNFSGDKIGITFDNRGVLADRFEPVSVAEVRPDASVHLGQVLGLYVGVQRLVVSAVEEHLQHPKKHNNIR